jgi:hypothetical protein
MAERNKTPDAAMPAKTAALEGAGPWQRAVRYALSLHPRVPYALDQARGGKTASMEPGQVKS